MVIKNMYLETPAFVLHHAMPVFIFYGFQKAKLVSHKTKRK